MPHHRTTPSLDALLEWSLQHQIAVVHRFLVVTATAVAVGLFRSLFIPGLLPWYFFIPFIVVFGLVLR